MLANDRFTVAAVKPVSSTTSDEPNGGATFKDKYNDEAFHHLVERANLPSGSEILVVGTGTGADTCWLADQGHRVTGMDVVAETIGMASVLAAALNSRPRKTLNWRTPAEAGLEIFEFVEGWYNPRRRHSALDYD